MPTVCGSALGSAVRRRAFDVVASAFGALPFVVDIAAALREVRRVLVPGGRAAFSVVHPVRRMFLDDPTETGMTITRSYFDRAAYVETADDGRPVVRRASPHDG